MKPKHLNATPGITGVEKNLAGWGSDRGDMVNEDNIPAGKTLGGWTFEELAAMTCGLIAVPGNAWTHTTSARAYNGIMGPGEYEYDASLIGVPALPWKVVTHG